MHVMKIVGAVRCMVNKVFFKHIGNSVLLKEGRILVLEIKQEFFLELA